MERYYVVDDNENHHDLALCQHVNIKHKNGTTRHLTVAHSTPKITAGTLVKVYETKDKNPFPLEVAYSYMAGGKRYVFLPVLPWGQYGLQKFWEKLSWFDCVRLHWDIQQALAHRGTVPAANRNTNLLLLCNDLIKHGR